MRITDEQRAANKDIIVETASRLFREKGYDGVGLSDIMKESGFTHGGFYNHFKSKDELIFAALEKAFDKLEEETRGKDISAIVNRYFSYAHRDDLSTGCPAPTLGAETARQSEAVKEAYERGVETWISMISEALVNEKETSPSKRRKIIIGYFAKLVGAITLARACPAGSKLHDEILLACKDSLMNEIKARSLL